MARPVMSITAAQIRRACALLRWGSPTLAERSGVAYELLSLAWRDDSVDAMSNRDRQAVRETLEGADVRFDGARGRPGTVLARCGG